LGQIEKFFFFSISTLTPNVKPLGVDFNFAQGVKANVQLKSRIYIGAKVEISLKGFLH
jgi:hypothetical protein